MDDKICKLALNDTLTSVNLSSYADRLRAERLISQVVLDYMRPHLINPNIQLYFDYSDAEGGAGVTAGTYNTFITIFLGYLDGSILYLINDFVGHIDFDRMDDSDLAAAAFILVSTVVNCIAHETTHINQNIDITMMNYKPYVELIEEDAVTRAAMMTKIILSDYPEEILDLVNCSAYKKLVGYSIPQTTIASLRKDLFRYYSSTFKSTILQFYMDMNDIDIVLNRANDIVIHNTLNGLDEKIYIKKQGVFLEPSVEFSKLFTTLYVNSANWLKICNNMSLISYVDDFNNVELKLSGSYLLPCFTKDIRNYYGVAGIYDEYIDKLGGI